MPGGPEQFLGPNGEIGYSYTTGTTGGAAYAIALGSKPRRDADVTLLTYRDGRPVGLQGVTLQTDGVFVVGDFAPLGVRRARGGLTSHRHVVRRVVGVMSVVRGDTQHMSGGRTITVDDATALDGAEIDVSARVAWVLRMARTTAGGPTQLRALADDGTSAARLSRMETGQLRDGRVVDGYEAALGLVAGSLRAPIDILCRSFPHSARATPNQGAASRASAPPGSPSGAGRRTVTGGEWLR